MANYTARDLVKMGTLPPRALDAFAECIRERRNVLITGRTGSGKTTLLQALTDLLPTDEPMLIIDDIGDLHLDGPHRERILLQRCDPAESPREVIALALRSAKGRLIVGNVCPPEAGEILRALSSRRHNGSLLAIGATSAETALRQIATWSLVDGFSWEAACHAVGEGISLVIRITRRSVNMRCVTEVACVEASEGGWTLRPL